MAWLEHFHREPNANAARTWIATDNVAREKKREERKKTQMIHTDTDTAKVNDNNNGSSTTTVNEKEMRDVANEQQAVRFRLLLNYIL